MGCSAPPTWSRTWPTGGSSLSSVQVWRVVTHTPERLSLPVLAALCDIFGCTPADLIATKADNVAGRRAASAAANVTDLAATVRPKRARVRPEPVSPAGMTAEQYQRWHIRDCARGGRRAAKAANWPDGPICRTCFAKATEVRGRCLGCSTDRLLPGRPRRWGRDLPGLRRHHRDFSCDRCSSDGYLLDGRLCRRCTLSDQLQRILDDGSGQVRPPLLPLVQALVSMPQPKTGLAWLASAHVRALLADVATGRLALTHEALRERPDWRTVAYLRDLLMSCGALSSADKQLLHAETWLHHRLGEWAGTEHCLLLRRFGLWHQVPRLRTRASTRPLTPASRRFAAEQFTGAERFLGWLERRGRQLGACTQADLDAWHAGHRNDQARACRSFLVWAMANGHSPRLALPRLQVRSAAPITQAHRLVLLRRVLTDGEPALRSRVAACLVLLYAQPVSRIVRLTVDDIVRDGAEVSLCLGDPPSPVPQPFAELLVRLAGDRQNMNSAANPASRWLFPGRRAGQPLNPGTLGPLIAELGIPPRPPGSLLCASLSCRPRRPSSLKPLASTP